MPIAVPLSLSVRDGVRLSVLAEFPEGHGPAAALVLAPGQRYPLTKPLIAETARQLLARGIAVFRFDWAEASGPPRLSAAEDLAARADDMRAVVQAARSDARVDASRLFVGGKSLGSVVAWAVMAGDPTLLGGLLLTPLCGAPAASAGATAGPRPDTHYPGIANDTRPLFLLAGDADPFCAVASLHHLAALAGGPSQVHILGGNHGLADPTGRDVEAEQCRAVQAGHLAADFVAAHLPG